MKMKKLILAICILAMAVPLWAGTTHYNFIYIPKYPDPESENYPTYMDNFFNDVDTQIWNVNQTKLNQDTVSPSNVTALTISPCTIQDADGGLISCLDVSWTDSINTDIDFYEVRYKPQGGSVYSYMQTTLLAIRITGLVGNTTYCVSVKGVDKQGNSSGYPNDNCSAASGADTSINPPTGLSAYPGFKQIWLDWSNPSDKDLALIEIWRADINDVNVANKIAEVKTDFYSDSLTNGVTKYYWVRAKDLSGNLSTWSNGDYAWTIVITAPDIDDATITNQKIANATIDLANKVQGQLPNSNLAQITDPAKLADAIITGAKIATGTIDNTKFVTGLFPIVKVSTLPQDDWCPACNYPEGAVVYLTTDDKLYRSTGYSWTTAVPTTDLSGTISTAQLADGAVTTVKLGDAQVSTQKLEDGSITTAKIGDNAIVTTKLADGSISKVKFANGLQPVESVNPLPTLPSADYPEGSVVFLRTDKKLYRTDGTSWTTATATSDLSGMISTTQLADGAVTTVKLGDAQVSTQKLVDGSITTAKIGDDQITTTKIADGSISAAKVGDSQVTATKLADGSVSQVKIASGNRILDIVTSLPTLPDSNYPQGATAFLTTENKLYRSTGTAWTAAVPATDLSGQITSTQITDSAISTPKLAANAVTAANIAANTITSNEIATNAITSDEILAGAIITSKIAAGAITSNEIAANTIVAGDIAAGTITGNEIAATTIKSGNIEVGAITAAQIATDTITAGNIAAGAIASSELATGAVVAGKIAAGTIVASDIAADTITAVNIAANAITVSELATNAVTSDKIVAGTITASDIATGTITATNIAAGTITGSLIAANTIAGSNIIAGDITASNIATDAITTTKIAAGAVQTVDIQAGAITADLVSTNQIITSTANIADAVITSAKIADASIQAADIANAQITSALIADASITTADIGALQVTGALIANATITDANISNLSADKITAGTLTGRTIQTDTSYPKGVLSSATKDLKFYNSSGINVASMTGNDATGGTLGIYHRYDYGYGVNIPAAKVESYGSIASLGVSETAYRTSGRFVAGLNIGTAYSTTGQVVGVTGLASADYIKSIGGVFIGEFADLRLGGTELSPTSGVSYKGSSIREASGTYRPIGYGVFGSVTGTTTPSVKRGTGFTVARTSTGHYTITFSSAFASTPIVLCTAEYAGDDTCAVSSVGALSFAAWVRNNGGWQDHDFNFFAIAN